MDPEWASWTDEQLLAMRMCDLGVTIEGTDLEQRIAGVNAELDARGLSFRPHYWLADEWFTPDDVPGIAIPFYLAHPRLEKLELAQKLEFMDRLMRELARRKPSVKSKRTVDPVARTRKTLGEHYRKKREHYGLDHPDFYDSDLRSLFSDAPRDAKNMPAARFVRKIRK